MELKRSLDSIFLSKSGQAMAWLAWLVPTALHTALVCVYVCVTTLTVFMTCNLMLWHTYITFQSHQLSLLIDLAMALRRRHDISQAFRNDHQLRQFVLTDVTTTGRVLGTGSYGSVEEVSQLAWKVSRYRQNPSFLFFSRCPTNILSVLERGSMRLS